jgi:hypothetical protein
MQSSPLSRPHPHVRLCLTVRSFVGSVRLLTDEPEDGKKIQDVKDARDKSSLEMKIRGRLYRIDLLSMEQTLINKMPELQDSPDERDGRKREVRTQNTHTHTHTHTQRACTGPSLSISALLAQLDA